MAGAGLIIGRFQPFHLGHLEVALRVFREQGSVKIAVGSAQYSRTPENPFRLEERIAMIRAALDGPGERRNYSIHPVEDIHDNARWVSHVRSIVGEFDAVYTANPLTRELFERSGCVVVFHPKLRGVSGSRIRQLIAAGDSRWKRLVPAPVAALISSGASSGAAPSGSGASR